MSRATTESYARIGCCRSQHLSRRPARIHYSSNMYISKRMCQSVEIYKLEPTERTENNNFLYKEMHPTKNITVEIHIKHKLLT